MANSKLRDQLRQWQYANLARFAEACVEPQLTPQQQLQRLNMLKAMVEVISDRLEIEADAAPSDERRLQEIKTRQRAAFE